MDDSSAVRSLRTESDVEAAQLEGITKVFGKLTALDEVSFTAKRGRIHALVGENGAGKTTLMRVLYGALHPDAGTISLHGSDVKLTSAADGIAHQIGMVSQHYAIIPELTCLQNLMLGAEPQAWIKQSDCIDRAEELATKMGFSFDWLAKAETLSPSGAQKLEILKLLWRDAEIMILDEPTAMLSPADSDALFGSLKQLADQGAAIIVVTHRLPEVLDYCEHVTVLRGGKLMADKPVSETKPEELAELIIGHGVEAPELDEFEAGDVLLKVDSLTVKGERGDDAVQGADLTLRSGEVVGLAGVDGSGQRELFQAILGLLSPVSGSILLCGADAARLSPSKRIEQGLRLIAEDRHAEGVVDDWSLEANASLGLQRLEPLRSGAWIDRKERADFAEQSTDLFGAKHQGIDKPMSSLSGGNQQRFVAARALLLRPKVILAFQPTRGLDIDGAAQVFSRLRKTCRSENAAALVVSFDLDELIEHTDRIVAMSGGRIQSPPSGEEKSRKIIGELMVEAG